MRTADRLRQVTAVFSFAGLSVLWLWVAAHPERYQWDLAIYYYVPTRDPDPYDAEGSRVAVAGTPLRGQRLHFTYPPHALYLFRPLGALPYRVVYYGWLLLKGVALGLVLLLGRRWLAPSGTAWLLPLMLLLGFDAALWQDLRSGNLALPEAALLLVGLERFRRRRYLPFAVAVAGAGLVKLWPLVFLTLLLAAREKLWRRLAAAGLLGGGLTLLALNAFAPPVHAYLKQVLPLVLVDPLRGGDNPSLGRWLMDLYLLGGIPPWRREVWLTYGAAAAFVLALALWRLRRLFAAGDDQALAAYGVLTWALLAPRFVTYSYVLVTVPWLAGLGRLRRGHRLLVAAALCPTQILLEQLWGYYSNMGPRSVWLLPVEYLPWLAVAALWAALTGAPLPPPAPADGPPTASPARSPERSSP